ncbi:hypothetical protein CDO73_10900 [Saccharibacillus sp. O23]|uniref:beta-N-acetylhexosaminidase n=1 Tax=Saccharibacillus sp. O23 TaxID=2009338 RepID=UPI000B4E76B7|nr:glycoside hydrolase family 20 protein [Saccharibacillus sp. O23]OWR30417.1 hypothetical protein CDO73_10900 [Saccharibacillus sp. O23]
MNPNIEQTSYRGRSVPSVRHAERSAGVWYPNPASALILLPGENGEPAASLRETVDAMREEFEDAGLLPNPLRVGGIDEADEGDLAVGLASVPGSTHPEAYRLEIGSVVRLTANTEQGVRHGLRTVRQLLAAGEGLPYGLIEDEPATFERALHLDIGRKFYPKTWILDRLREMSELKLNTLQLHFSENEGFTFESERHPEVMSEHYLTKAEIREIVAEANRLHIALIPSLDSPGHLAYALRHRPEWLLTDANGEPARGALDITNPEAAAFVMDLIDEYAELFEDSEYFHIGGDEFIDFSRFADYPQLGRYAREELGIEGGTEVDAYVAYLNEVARRLEARGFVARVWNDGLYRDGAEQKVELKTSMQIAYWTKWDRKMAAAQTFADKGHKLVNFNDAYFYYVLGEHAGYVYPTGEKIYESWHPGLLPRIAEGEPQEWTQPYPPALIGCSFSVWSDKPEAQTVEEVAAGIREPLRAMAELAWAGEKRYGDYGAFAEICRAAGLRG